MEVEIVFSFLCISYAPVKTMMREEISLKEGDEVILIKDYEGT